MELRERDVSVKVLARVPPLLDRLHGCGTGRDSAGNRTLFFDDYAKLVLVYLFNPLIDSISMLQRAAELPKLARQLGVKPFSKASFSEAPAVFDPAMMQAVVRELAADARALPADPRLADLKHAGVGVQIQIYGAMIACLLLNLATGVKPCKALMEVLLWRQLGFATDDDVLARVEKTKRGQAKAHAKKIGG